MMRAAVIDFIGSAPFASGLKHLVASGEMECIFCTPAQCADSLRSGEVDLALCPVAAIPGIRGSRIVSDFCIGATGTFGAALVCSPVPIEEADVIHMDVDARTSILLTRILCERKWNVAPRFEPRDFSSRPVDTSLTCLLTGDKALQYGDGFRYVYDLASEWYELKEMPFVFACWTAVRDLEPQFIQKFNQALMDGISDVQGAVKNHVSQFSGDSAAEYLRDKVSYALDDEKRAGLTEFWRVALEELNPRACRS